MNALNNKGNKPKNNDLATSSSHRCCAERRLLDSWVVKARRRGLGAHQIVTWVRRKVGAHVTVFRTLADGSLGCAAPCLLCQRELLRFDLRVHCSLAPERWWSGRLTDDSAPRGKLTARQRMMMPGADQQQQQQPGELGGGGGQQAGGGDGCGEHSDSQQQQRERSPPHRPWRGHPRSGGGRRSKPGGGGRQ